MAELFINLNCYNNKNETKYSSASSKIILSLFHNICYIYIYISYAKCNNSYGTKGAIIANLEIKKYWQYQKLHLWECHACEFIRLWKTDDASFLTIVFLISPQFQVKKLARRQNQENNLDSKKSQQRAQKRKKDEDHDSGKSNWDFSLEL